MRNKIEKAEFDFSHPIWGERSRQAQSFVASLLKVDPNKRLDARRALRHQWFRKSFEPGVRPPFVEDDNEGRAFEEACRDTMFKANAINELAFNSSAKDIFNLRDVLENMRNTGSIPYSEFKKALRESGFSSELISKVFDNVDLSKEGTFEYREFLKAAILAKGYLVEVRLAETFDSMDSKGGGFVTREDIQSLIGSAFEALRVDDIFDGMEVEGKLSFQDFLHLFDRQVEMVRQKNESVLGDVGIEDWGT